jgi:RNA polymerase sigma-70 factor (ECF subfamily)
MPADDSGRWRRVGELEDGHRERFEELALPHLRALYRLAMRFVGERADAEDLVQETYLKALQSFASLQNPASVKPWLVRILSRLAVDRHRKGQREVTIEAVEDLDRFSLYDLIWEEDPLPYSDRLHDDFLAQFEDDEIRGALRALPQTYRIPLVLLYTEEMSYRELAEFIGCPVGTVMSRLHRGRKILERELWECAKRRGLVRTWKRSDR